VVLPSLGWGEGKGPNDRIQLGFIGVGTMGRGHLGGFLGYTDVQVVAVCDVVKERLESAKKMVEDRYAKSREKEKYNGCVALTDFRELIERKDIDAVVIATPDHWHALPAVYAARAGKDIYCEKPLTRTIAEGRRVVEEAKKHYREYAGGGLADMGAHHFDIAQWALNMDGSGPVSIEPPEGKAESGLRYVYANGVEMFHGGKSGCTFEGTDGIIYVDRGTIESTPAGILKEPLGDKAERVYHSDNHKRNWIECLRSRKETICPAEVGHRSATVCHLGNLGYQLRKKLKWDPVKEKFDDDEANKLIDQAMREPWKF
jgi:predicted dehydrogenase